jgi:hypothetical protein
MRNVRTVIIIFFLWSCQDVKRPEIPADLIPEEQMVDVLTEVYLVNAARSFDNRTIMDNKMKLDSFIYKKFDIDSLQFVRSNAYYTSNLATYDRLFLKVQKRMQAIKKDVDSLMLVRVKEMEEQRIKDSIAGGPADSTLDDNIELKVQDSIKVRPKLIEPKSD